MKEKHYKYIEDVLEAYLLLMDERDDLPAVIDKANKKYAVTLKEHSEAILKKGDLADAYKFFIHIRKAEDRITEIEEELKALREHIRRFLVFLHGKEISYERKDDTDKQKVDYIFRLQGDEIKFISQ